MIRILGGEYRGRSLRQPRALASRPSSARLRGALFSALGEKLSGRWADLFCGVGGFGIEALGRGAEFLHFVDVEPAALSALAANLESLTVPAKRFRISRGDARRWLEREAREEDESWAGIFADPPYGGSDPELLLPLAGRLVESGRVAIFVLEHAAEAKLPELKAMRGIRLRSYNHGRGAFTLVEGIPS